MHESKIRLNYLKYKYTFYGEKIMELVDTITRRMITSLQETK